MSDESDKAVTTFQEKFTASYGGGVQGAKAIPWDVILAALMSLLDGCLPANVKTQSRRPLVQARMRIRLLAHGIPLRDLGRTVNAAVAAVEASDDNEIAGYVMAAQE